MKQDNIPGYPGYYLDRNGNLWRFKEVRLYDSGKFTLKELSIKFNCKNMSRIVRRTKGEIVK